MKIVAKGNPTCPCALMIHPALADPDFFARVIDALHGRYRLILPTLSGHFTGSHDFISVQAETDSLRRLLAGEKIDRIDVLFGCGLGGLIGLELLAHLPASAVRHAVFDSLPCTDSGFLRSSRARELRAISKLSQSDPQAAALRVDTADELYAAHVVRIAPRVSQASIDAIASAERTCKNLPELSCAKQCSSTFLWGSLDPAAAKSFDRIKTTYPHARCEMLSHMQAFGDLFCNCDYYVKHYLPH